MVFKNLEEFLMVLQHLLLPSKTRRIFFHMALDVFQVLLQFFFNVLSSRTIFRILFQRFELFEDEIFLNLMVFLQSTIHRSLEEVLRLVEIVSDLSKSLAVFFRLFGSQFGDWLQVF